MARAEHTGVTNIIRVETCDHLMCTCKTQFNDAPAEIFVAVEMIIGEQDIRTSLRMMDDGPQRTIDIRGIRRPEEIAEKFNGCEGPEITAAGLICGAIHRLGRK